MKLQADQLRLQSLLKDTVLMLCKNALRFNKSFGIDALIGITTDDASTFLLKLEETVGVVGGDDEPEDESDGDNISRETSRSSRKRPPDVDICSTESKRYCCDDDDSDVATHDYKESNAGNNDVISEDTNANADNNTDNFVSTVNDQNKESDTKLVIVTPEFAPADPSQLDYAARDDTAPDDTAPDDTAPDVNNFDDGSHDGSSTWNQSSVANDPSASVSQQVRCCMVPWLPQNVWSFTVGLVFL